MDFSKETILIVDDSRFQRTVIRELFSEHFNLLEASSGGECMRIIQENTSAIDLVLLDLVMPGVDGFEVLRRRQSMQEFLDIPVIVLTTSDSHTIQANSYELGANDFLTKPIDQNTALSRIQNLLKSKRRVRSLIQKYVEFKVKSELDEMTGLFNKTTTINLITDTLSKFPDEHHALLIVDIDNFKAINDVFGHTVGDHTICIVSNVITSQFSGTDIVGRIGGDEFVVFIRNVSSKKDVYEKTTALVNIISEKKNLSIPDNVTISIGLVFSDGTDMEYSTLFAKADEALYSSKHSGKSCYSEYGVGLSESEVFATTSLVYTDSRNVLSMLEFACEPRCNVTQVHSVVEIAGMLSNAENDISCIYIDISDEKDNGAELLRKINEVSPSDILVVVICREGCMEQIRLAAGYDFTGDILYSPLETATLKRRVAAHIKIGNNKHSNAQHSEQTK